MPAAMRLPVSPEIQLAIFTKIRGLLEDCKFTSTHKFALLLSPTNNSVTDGDDFDVKLMAEL
jgi:hypothetical protein